MDIILQSIGRDGTKDISFTVAEDNQNAGGGDSRGEQASPSGFERYQGANDKVCKLSIVGAGMVNNPGVAAMMFEALSGAEVNIQMISTSEIKISVLIDQDDGDRAVESGAQKVFRLIRSDPGCAQRQKRRSRNHVILRFQGDIVFICLTSRAVWREDWKFIRFYGGHLLYGIWKRKEV